MAAEAAITFEQHPEAVRATIRPARFDDAVTEQVQQQVPAAAAQSPGLPVILDLTAVDYVPSLGLGTLVGLMRTLRQGGHRFLLVGVQPEVREVLTITRLDRLFEIRASFEEALAHLRGQP